MDADYKSQLREPNVFCMRKTKEPISLQEPKAAPTATRKSPEPDDQRAESSQEEFGRVVTRTAPCRDYFRSYYLSSIDSGTVIAMLILSTNNGIVAYC